MYKRQEHVDPEEIGNSRNIVVSDQAGQSNIMSRLKSIGIQIEKNDPKIKKLLSEVKTESLLVIVMMELMLHLNC